MAKTYQQIQSEIERLQAEAESIKTKEAADVLARIREAIAVYGFTPTDLGLGGRGRKVAAKVPVKHKVKPAKKAKYADGNGNTWGGMGPRPAWFRAALEAGKTPEELLA